MGAPRHMPREIWMRILDYAGPAGQSLAQLDRQRREWFGGAVCLAQVYGTQQALALADTFSKDTPVVARIEVRHPRWLAWVPNPMIASMRQLSLRFDIGYIDLVAEARRAPTGDHAALHLHGAAIDPLLTWLYAGRNLRTVSLSMTRLCLANGRFADMWNATVGSLPHLETFEWRAMTACIDVRTLDPKSLRTPCSATLHHVTFDLSLNSLTPMLVCALVKRLEPAPLVSLFVDVSGNGREEDWSALLDAIWTPPWSGVARLGLRMRNLQMEKLGRPLTPPAVAMAWRTLRLDVAENALTNDGIASFFQAVAERGGHLERFDVDLYHNLLTHPPACLPPHLHELSVRIGSNPIRSVRPFIEALAAPFVVAELRFLAFRRDGRVHERKNVRRIPFLVQPHPMARTPRGPRSGARNGGTYLRVHRRPHRTVGF